MYCVVLTGTKLYSKRENEYEVNSPMCVTKYISISYNSNEVLKHCKSLGNEHVSHEVHLKQIPSSVIINPGECPHFGKR